MSDRVIEYTAGLRGELKLKLKLIVSGRAGSAGLLGRDARAVRRLQR